MREMSTPVSLLTLPVDVLLGIMGFLEIEDQFHLGLCCKDLSFLFYHDEIYQRNLLVSKKAFWV